MANHCDACGAFIDGMPKRHRWDGPQSCGEPACERECRDLAREEDAEAEERAREDGYDRYR